MAREKVVGADEPNDPKERDAALRPKMLREVIGQKAVVQRLGITYGQGWLLGHPEPLATA